MLISYNWLKDFVDIDKSPEELENILTMLGIEVDAIIDYRKKYENFYTATVTKCEKHPDADKLSICEVELNNDKYQVICGAPNVAAGQKVAFATPGAVVPSAGFTIEKRKIRGVESSGMICSAVELEVGEDASGIMVLPEDTETGMPLAKYFGLDDTVYEVSLTPNKADALSHLGVARDVAAYLRKEVRKPEIKFNENSAPVEDSIDVIIEAPDLCPRYTARVIRDVKVGESPEWLKKRLIAVGLRPINAAVDVTNYVMMEYGQPLHAFDYDLIEGGKIIIKRAGDKEKFTTLDGKLRELDSEMLMICDGRKSIAVGGVMGGENTEISDKTKNILLESAFFNPSSVRRTSKKLGIQSDSSYRFERGVDVDNVEYASRRAAQLIAEVTGGTVESGVVDAYPNKIEKKKVTLRYRRTRDVIGAEINNNTIKEIIEALQFKVIKSDQESITVEVPSFRVDVELEIDLIEEVARLYNYDNIEPSFASISNLESRIVPDKLHVPAIRSEISRYLINRGYYEIITQNMLDPKSSELFTDDPVVISNPLGEELSIMRSSAVPAMLRTIEKNIRLGTKDMRFFEIGKIFIKEDNPDNFIEGVHEKHTLIIALTGNSAPVQWGAGERAVDFYDIKGAVTELFEILNFRNLRFKASENAVPVFSATSMDISYRKEYLGTFGQVDRKLLKHFDLEHDVYLAVIDLENLYKQSGEASNYEPVSPYPAIARDLAFVFPKEVTYNEVINEIKQMGGKYLKEAEIFDVFEGKKLGEDKRSMAFSLIFSSSQKTLEEKDVEPAVQKIVKNVESKFKGELRQS